MSRLSENMFSAGAEFGSELARTLRKFVLKSVVIESVDEDAGVANVTAFEGDATMSVPLAFLGTEGSNLMIIPTVGSVAMIANLNADEETPQFVSFESVDKIAFTRESTRIMFSLSDEESVTVSVGASSIKLTDEGVTINGGELGGLVVTSKLTERMNRLKSEIDAIQANILAHTHATPSGPTSSTVYTKANVSSFSDDDYINEKVTQ